VHVVSGRTRDTLEAWLGALPIGLHAEHGLWSRVAPGEPWRALEDVPVGWKERVRSLLEEFRARVPGSLVEEKTASLAWHYRQVDSEFGAYQARELRLHLAESFTQGALEVLPGDKVVEVRPRGVNKGRVVASALKGTPQGTFTIALGDDRTDEDLFAALPMDALAIHVGPQLSRAAVRLADPRAVRDFLGRLAG
jgi:trehalose 6-phosphate synthase/phosphatase